MQDATVGDWEVCTVDNGESDDEIITHVNGCVVNIAVVRGACDYSEARPLGEPEPAYTVSPEEARANAYLLASARRLRATLERLVQRAEANPLYPLRIALDDADVRAELARARGET